MVRFIHTADWQIGMKGAGLGEAGSLVAARRLETLDAVFASAAENDVDLVLACGDLFEHNEVDEETVDRVAATLTRHPAIRVHGIPGNHDLPGPGSVWNRAALTSLDNLWIHVTEEAVELPEVVLHPLPVRSRYSSRDPLGSLPELGSDPRVHVGLAHGHLTSITFGAHEDDIVLPLDPAHVARSGLDYLACGHWHGTRLVPGADGVARIAYSGTHEQTSWRETDAGNVLLVEISEKGAPPKITPIRVGAFQWERQHLDLTGDVDLDRVRDRLARVESAFLDMEVEGEMPLSHYGAWQQIWHEAEERIHAVRLRDQALRWVPEKGPEILSVEDPALQRVLDALRDEAAAGGDDQSVVREAVGLFNRLVQEVDG